MRSNLKLAIIESEHTQYDLARKLRISESRLSRIVKGRLEPTESEKRTLAVVLNHTIADLFGEERK